jgi:hypothetical protein
MVAMMIFPSSCDNAVTDWLVWLLESLSLSKNLSLSIS